MFLCTRVTKSTIEAKAKLKHFPQFLKKMIDDKKTMVSENIIQLFTRVDAA